MGPAASAFLPLNEDRRAFTGQLTGPRAWRNTLPLLLRVLDPLRTPLGSHYLAHNSSLSLFLSVSLSFCLFLSLLLTQCGSISFSLVRILALCFFQAHLTFPVLFGNYFFIKTKGGKMERLLLFSVHPFWKWFVEGLHERKGKRECTKANLINSYLSI